MSTYTFDPAMADQVRDDMATVTMRLQAELESMHNQVMTTLADWKDGAKDQYDIAKREWDKAAGRMPASLNAAEVALAEISGGYLKIEHTGVNQWGGFTVR